MKISSSSTLKAPEGDKMALVEHRIGGSVFCQRQQSIEPEVYKKLVIVGDGGCGKSSLLKRAAHNTYDPAYNPTVFDNYSTDVDVGLSTVELALWDSPGLEAYDELRPLSYPDKDVVLICFDISNPESLENVKTKWVPEVKHNCPGVPVILLGLKKDLRKDRNIINKLQSKSLKPVTTKQAAELAENMGVNYLECSAKASKGVDEVFQLVARTALCVKKQEG